MIYNVLIADDEYFIRRRLEKSINWEELNLNLIGEAENGQQVIDLLSKHSIDLLLLDIKMPIKNGIDVMNYIVDHGLSTRVIILSGYNDFDYVQKALKLKAEDYLIKPVKKEDLHKTLIACKEQLNAFNQKEQELKNYQQQRIKTNLYNLLTKKDELRTNGCLPDYILSNNYFVLIGIYSEQYVDDLISSINEVICIDNYYILSLKGSENDSVIFISYNEEDEYNMILEACQCVNNQIPDYTFITITQQVPLSEKDWTFYYEQVRRGLDQRYFTTSEDVYLAPLAVRKPATSPTYLHDQFNLLLKTNDSPEVTAFIKKVFEQIGKVGTRSYLGLALTEIYVVLHMNYPQQFKQIYHLNQYIDIIIDENHSLDTLEKLVMDDISNCLQALEADKSIPSPFVDKIIQYLNQHYMEPSISVVDLSKQFQRNSSYIGSIFKKHTGQSVVQYITHLRMDKAKALLSTNQYNITEIASMVGYTDVFYFSRKFKKLFGCSPKNY